MVQAIEVLKLRNVFAHILQPLERVSVKEVKGDVIHFLTRTRETVTHLTPPIIMASYIYYKIQQALEPPGEVSVMKTAN